MRNHFDDVFAAQAESIKVYVGKETIQDPYEKNVTFAHLNAIPLKAVVEDLTTTQAKWKMPGISVSKVKEITVKYKYRTIMERSSKIIIDDEEYEGWRDNGRMQLREDKGITGDGYLRLYVYSKVT